VASCLSGGVHLPWVTDAMSSEEVYERLRQNPPPPQGGGKGKWRWQGRWRRRSRSPTLAAGTALATCRTRSTRQPAVTWKQRSWPPRRWRRTAGTAPSLIDRMLANVGTPTRALAGCAALAADRVRLHVTTATSRPSRRFIGSWAVPALAAHPCYGGVGDRVGHVRLGRAEGVRPDRGGVAGDRGRLCSLRLSRWCTATPR
jgi:hypothetical protein